MNVSSVEQKRWVIQGVDVVTVRRAKALAAEHDVRIADVVAQAINEFWEYLIEHNEPKDGWGNW